MLNHRVVGGVLVEVAQRWIVEAGAVEQLRGGVDHHGDEPDVDHLGRLFTHHVHTQQAQIVPVEKQFQESRLVANDVAARNVRVTGAADDIGNLLFAQRRFRVPHATGFGNGVDAGRQQRRDIALEGFTEGVEDGDARLLDARGRQRWRTDDIARGIDVRHFGGLKMRADLHQAAFARREAGSARG